MAVADSMTVLRDGEFVARREIKDTSASEIAELMIGRKVEKLVDKINGKQVQDWAKRFFATAECKDIVIKSK